MGLTRAIECATATAALALIAQGYRLNHPTQFDINRHLDSTSPVPTLTPSPTPISKIGCLNLYSFHHLF